MRYYILYNHSVIGPMSAGQLLSYNPDVNTNISTDGINWAPLYTYPELMQMVRDQSTYGPGSTDSKRILCGIMAILLGGLGVQYFILGKVSGGFITILLTLVTCGAWEIITLIQGILMLCMSDEEFNRKYVYTTKTLPLF